MGVPVSVVSAVLMSACASTQMTQASGYFLYAHLDTGYSRPIWSLLTQACRRWFPSPRDVSKSHNPRANNGTHQRVVPTQRHRQPPVLRMLADGLRDLLAHLGHAPRVLEDADRGVVLDRRRDALELVVPVKVDLPAELLELARQARLDEPDGALVHARARLRRGVSPRRSCTL